MLLRQRYFGISMQTQFTRNQNIQIYTWNRAQKNLNHLETEGIPLRVQKTLKKKVNAKNTGLFQLLILMYGPHYSSWHCTNISLAYCQIIAAPQLPSSTAGNF